MKTETSNIYLNPSILSIAFNIHTQTKILLIVTTTLLSCFFSSTFTNAEGTCSKSTDKILTLIKSDNLDDRYTAYMSLITGRRDFPGGGTYGVIDSPECEYLLIELLNREGLELDKYMEIYGNYEFDDVANGKKGTEDYMSIDGYFKGDYSAYLTELIATVLGFDNPDIVEPLVNIGNVDGLEKYGDRTIEAVLKRLDNNILYDNSMFMWFSSENMNYIKRNGKKYKNTKYYKDIKNTILKRLKSKKKKGKYRTVLTLIALEDDELNDFLIDFNYDFEDVPMNEEFSNIKKELKEKKEKNKEEELDEKTR